jgi:hypothetical protein
MRGMKNKRFACSLFDSMCDGMRGMPQMHAYIIFKLMSPIQAELVALIYSSREIASLDFIQNMKKMLVVELREVKNGRCIMKCTHPFPPKVLSQIR